MLILNYFCGTVVLATTDILDTVKLRFLACPLVYSQAKCEFPHVFSQLLNCFLSVIKEPLESTDIHV